MTQLRLSPQLLRSVPPDDARHIRHAWNVIRLRQANVLRRSGESYAQHGMEVATALRELSDDPALLRVALLHDAAASSDANQILADAGVSEEEQRLIDGMQQLRRLHIDQHTQDLDTVIDAFTEDDRLLLLRMAHRLNDVRHLHRFDRMLRIQIARETLHMYTAIANRIGLHRWRIEMEDICFPVVHPHAAAALRRQFRSYAALDNACLRHAERFLKRHLRAAGLHCTITTRRKGLYSTYRKMLTKNRRFHELTDRLALRIVVDSTEECYRALCVVHVRMHPMAGKLKDYIGAPKENGYRSIHTVVYPLPGISEQPIEIQIRTQEMQDEADRGFASHTRYKTWSYTLHSSRSRVHLLANLDSLRAECRSVRDFEHALRSFFREDHLALFDTSDRLLHLRKPATALDFVCAAFPERVARLRAIRVNGRFQPADTPLRDGDTVEPLFGRTRTIANDWLGSCRHPQSKRVLRGLLAPTKITGKTR